VRTLTFEEGLVTRYLKSRNAVFLFFSTVTLLLFYPSLSVLFVQSLHDSINDYILVIPFISAFFFYSDRTKIFSIKEYSFGAGVGIIVLGVAVSLIGFRLGDAFNQNDRLSIVILSCVIIWMGGFVLFYGAMAFRNAIFPILFLLFLVPIPSLLLLNTISILQEGSAETAMGLFRLSGVPVLREGFVFHLSHLSIEVAEECSGIHSALALLVTSIVAGKLFLITGWKKWVLTMFVFPIAIFKNGLRIVTLSLLGNYVYEYILSCALHREGGIPFFLLAVGFLMVVLWILRRSEIKSRALPKMKQLPVQLDSGNR